MGADSCLNCTHLRCSLRIIHTPGLVDQQTVTPRLCSRRWWDPSNRIIAPRNLLSAYSVGQLHYLINPRQLAGCYSPLCIIISIYFRKGRQKIEIKENPGESRSNLWASRGKLSAQQCQTSQLLRVTTPTMVAAWGVWHDETIIDEGERQRKTSKRKKTISKKRRYTAGCSPHPFNKARVLEQAQQIAVGQLCRIPKTEDI